VLNGVGAPGDAPGPMMPPFRNMLSDVEIVAIGDYLRRSRLILTIWPVDHYDVDRMRGTVLPEPKTPAR